MDSICTCSLTTSLEIEMATNWNAMQSVLSKTEKGSGVKPVRGRNADVKPRYMTMGSWHANLSLKGVWKR